MVDKFEEFLMAKLDDLLDAEQRFLLDGNLEGIAGLLSQKERFIDEINALQMINPDTLGTLQSKVKRNQILLDGALQGIRRASARMAAIRRIRRSLETYGEDGRRQTIEGEVVRNVEKRA